MLFRSDSSPRAKLLILNSPCNPTGSLYSREELAALGEVLLRHPRGAGLWILSDEIYDRVILGEKPFTSFLEACPGLRDRVITINGMSKAAAMTGWLSRFFARLFARGEPALSDATPRDAAALADIHAASFRHGWSDGEFTRFLMERNVVAQRATLGRSQVGFIISRIGGGEAEILSVAVIRSQQGRGLARRLLTLHLGRLAGLGVKAVFLEVDEDNAPARRLYARAGFREVGRRPGYYPKDGGQAATALILRRDLV